MGGCTVPSNGYERDHKAVAAMPPQRKFMIMGVIQLALFWNSRCMCPDCLETRKGAEVAVVGWYLGILIGGKINAAEGTEVDGAPETLVQTENAALLDHFPVKLNTS
jgi:hypothetical protein